MHARFAKDVGDARCTDKPAALELCRDLGLEARAVELYVLDSATPLHDWLRRSVRREVDVPPPFTVTEGSAVGDELVGFTLVLCDAI